MNWEPWTGCYKISDGCNQCYFYEPHANRYGQNTIEKTDKFDWPIKRRFIACSPLLEEIDISPYLDGVVLKINPFKQGNLAKKLDINISDGRRLF